MSSPLNNKRFEEIKKNDVDNRKPFEKTMYNQHQLTSQNSMNIKVINHIIQEAKPEPSKSALKEKDEITTEKADNKEFGIQNSRRKKNLEGGNNDKAFQSTFYGAEQKNRDSSKLLNDNIDIAFSKHEVNYNIYRQQA